MVKVTIIDKANISKIITTIRDSAATTTDLAETAIVIGLTKEAEADLTRITTEASKTTIPTGIL